MPLAAKHVTSIAFFSELYRQPFNRELLAPAKLRSEYLTEEAGPATAAVALPMREIGGRRAGCSFISG